MVKTLAMVVIGLAALALGLLVFGGMAPSSPVAAGPAAQPEAVETAGVPTLEWFGWSHFRITSVNGTVIHTNPFITGNPDASITLNDIQKANLILVPNGHGDELGDTIAIAQKTGAQVVAGGFELGSWLIEKGLTSTQVIRSNPGNWHQFGDITIRVVGSVHGSGLPQPTAQNPYGGPAAGFFITLENGYTIYFAGSSAATMDMQMWGAAFKPDLAIVPLNTARDPMDAAQIVRLVAANNPNLKQVIAHHHRVVPPPGTTTVAQWEEAIHMMGTLVRVVKLQRNMPFPLTK
ncbi:MAG: MBL fold metallo-hydrolase [Chloroflexi bacterium]|nr:MBL fold metallo-hydrolase [Chloroflexota bacterium]